MQNALTRAKIAHFEEQFGEQHGMFACQASVPLLLSTDLLYKLWLNFNTYNVDGQTKKIPHWAVSDLLLAGFCQPVGYQLYKLEPEIRSYLQQLLVERLGTDRQIQLAGFLRQFAEKYYGGSEKNIQEIHLLTAESILNPAEMERQLSEQLQQTMSGNKADVVNLLTLYFNLSGEKSQEAGSENYINLVAEDDPSAPGYLNVILPRFLQDRVQEGPVATLTENAQENEEKPSDALLLINKCLEGGSSLLDLGCCGLKDADFAEGSFLDMAIRRCLHINTFILSNEWYEWYYDKRVKQKSINSGINNKLTKIPDCISSLIKLNEFTCNGNIDESWAIRDLAPLAGLKNLTLLNLSYNQINDVSYLKEMHSLAEIDLSYNQISDISPCRSIFPVHLLDIRHNKVTSLQPLADMLKGEFFFKMVTTPEPETREDAALYLYGNPITDPPAEVLNKGTAAIVEYFQHRQDNDQKPKEYYIYDIYISYSHNTAITKKLIGIFIDEVNNVWAGDRPSIFIDNARITEGDDLPESMRAALRHSKIILTFLSPSYFKRRNSLVEWLSFTRRSGTTKTPLVFPVALFKGEYLKNPLLESLQYTDFSDFNLFTGDIDTADPVFNKTLHNLIGQVQTALKDVPEYNETWEIVQDSEIVQLLNPTQPPKQIKVYLSSTYSDLKEYWQLILQIKSSLLQDYKINFISMEGYAQRSIIENLLQDVQSCDIFLLIIGNRYGFVPDSQPDQLPEGRSIVEIEYDAARSFGKMIQVYIADPTSGDWVQTEDDMEHDENRQKKLSAFKARLHNEALVRSFVKPLQLQQMVEEDLALLLKKEPKPRLHVNESYEIFSIYLSYADGNETFINKLREDLMTRFPLLTIFESRDTTDPSSLIKEISDKITKADFFVFILSEAYSSSKFCWEEFQIAKLNEYNRREAKIFPIKISDAEPPLIMAVYTYYDFMADHQLAFDALASSFAEKMPVIKTVADQKKLYIVHSAEDGVFYNDLKDTFRAKGINVSNIDVHENSRSYQEDLHPLIESPTVFILLSNADFPPRCLAKCEYARQQKKKIELLVADGTIVPAQLQSFSATVFDIDNDDDLQVLLYKYQYLLPEEKETITFYKREILSQLVISSGKSDIDERIMEFLLIFKTSTQQTWLAFSDRNIFCLLDDLGKRDRSRFVQWKAKLEDVNNQITTGRPYQKNTGVVNIGTRKNWLYSYSLFRKPEIIVDTINEYIRKCLGQDKNVP